MKIRIILISMAIIAGFQNPVAHAFVKPVVESFTFTPKDIELTGDSSKVSFELIVSHPLGIESTKSDVTLKSSKGDSLVVSLFRTDSPIDLKKSRVTFAGSLDLPRELLPGVYDFSASSVKNNSSAGYQYETGLISSIKVRNLPGAENGLLVRSYGNLNLDYSTFQGPTYDTTLGVTYTNISKYNSNNKPIFKVGETYNPLDYFELRVPSLEMSVSSTTPNVCTSDKKIMKFIAEGNCTFAVSTPKDKDYLARSVTLSATVTSARVKPTINLERIPNQTATDLPKTIQLVPVFGPAASYILPKSETPSVCTASLLFVRITRGGTCTLSYQTPQTPDFLASDIALQTFEIVRTPQTIEFAPPISVRLNLKAIPLIAKVSSNENIEFSAQPVKVCQVSGNELRLLSPGNCSITAQNLGTATIAPISKTVNITISGKAKSELRTISCIKGSKKVSVTKAKPKCPKGYSRVR